MHVANSCELVLVPGLNNIEKCLVINLKLEI